jgi:predicted TIM-barrel fold metal-dependent hydrolase
LHRRRFLQAATALAATANVAAAEDKRPAGKYIDVHTHLGQTWNTTERLAPEELLRWMDAHEIAKAVVLPLMSPESSSYLVTCDFVLEATKPHRERLIPFCCLDPRTSYQGGQKGLTDMLRRWVDGGARGFGEHKPGVAIDDARSMKLYEACAELKMPVLFHCDNLRNTDKPELPGLTKVLETFPTVNFLGHAQGWWASISGGVSQADLDAYPKTEVRPGGAIDALMEKYPNIHGDLSAGSGANAIARDKKFGREFLIRRADRLCFGTDFLAPKQAVPQFELFESLDLPKEVQAKIFRGNAEKLLGL